MLVRRGYGVLMLDMRGYDGSQGDPNMFGWDDTRHRRRRPLSAARPECATAGSAGSASPSAARW